MKTSYPQEEFKIEKNDFELIKGKFSPDDAQEILSNLLQKKIDYHNLRIFSQYERFGTNDEFSQSRLKELKRSFESIQAIIAEARDQGDYLIINSSISIEIRPS